MAGRGSFIESFPLFGYSLDDYDTLFAEKLEMLLQIRSGEMLDWPGGTHTHRVPGLGIYPRPVQDPIPVWIAVGGTPNSVARAGYLGLPLAVAIIGGKPQQFAPLVELYREAAKQGGHDPEKLPIGINSHGYLADTDEAALNESFPAHQAAMAKIGRERGWPPMSRAQYEAGAAPGGAYLVGSPQAAIDKILQQHEWFKHDRFMLQISVGTLPHKQVLRAIELLGTIVKPAVNKALAQG